MSDVRKILGEFQSYEEKEFGGVVKYIIKYKQPNSAQPDKVWSHQAVEDDLSEKAIEKLISLSAGEKCCVHQDKDEKGYPVIKDVSDVKDAPEKYAGGATQYKKGVGSFTPKDETGIAVGAAYTNAIEIIKLAGTTKTVEELIILVDQVAAKVLVNKLAQEVKLRASKAGVAKEEPKMEEKKKSKAELMREKKAAVTAPKREEVAEDSVELEDDDLDNVNF
jgi:hypothetical protein